MRWQRSPRPQEGDQRTKRPFAWWPIMDPQSRTVYWLERVEVTGRFMDAIPTGVWLLVTVQPSRRR